MFLFWGLVFYNFLFRVLLLEEFVGLVILFTSRGLVVLLKNDPILSSNWKHSFGHLEYQNPSITSNSID